MYNAIATPGPIICN